MLLLSQNIQSPLPTPLLTPLAIEDSGGVCNVMCADSDLPSIQDPVSINEQLSCPLNSKLDLTSIADWPPYAQIFKLN